jgi:hypothetical protein
MASSPIRRKAGRNLGFGEGIHFCLGVNLARLQMRVVLDSLLPVMPAGRLAPSDRRRIGSVGAVRACANGVVEVLGELGMVFADARYAVPDSARHA